MSGAVIGSPGVLDQLLLVGCVSWQGCRKVLGFRGERRRLLSYHDECGAGGNSCILPLDILGAHSGKAHSQDGPGTQGFFAEDGHIFEFSSVRHFPQAFPSG
jgi:hypothetical protein